MSSLWSKTSAAINNGFGEIAYGAGKQEILDHIARARELSANTNTNNKIIKMGKGGSPDSVWNDYM